MTCLLTIGSGGAEARVTVSLQLKIIPSHSGDSCKPRGAGAESAHANKSYLKQVTKAVALNYGGRKRHGMF